MTFTEEASKECAKIHANHQLSKITSKIAQEIDKAKEERVEIDERLRILEDKA